MGEGDEEIPASSPGSSLGDRGAIGQEGENGDERVGAGQVGLGQR